MASITQYRQGDILLERISSLPDQPLLKLDSSIVARGERSNHAHAIIGNASILENKDDKTLYVQIKSCAQLKHVLEISLISSAPQWTSEHLDIYLEEGIYRVIHQREYDPYKNIERRVWD